MINMTNKELQEEIITDLKNDFPEIEIETENDNIIIRADTNTLWEIFEILYKGLDNVEFNMDKDEDNHIIIKT